MAHSFKRVCLPQFLSRALLKRSSIGASKQKFQSITAVHYVQNEHIQNVLYHQKKNHRD